MLWGVFSLLGRLLLLAILQDDRQLYGVERLFDSQQFAYLELADSARRSYWRRKSATLPLNDLADARTIQMRQRALKEKHDPGNLFKMDAW